MKFNRIPFVWDYQRFKYIFKNKTDGVNDPRIRSLKEAVDSSMYFFFEGYEEENGMDYVVLIINAFLYEIEYGKTDPDLTQTVKNCIKEFETGKYDDLFKVEALTLLYEDIAVIKKYLSQQ